MAENPFDVLDRSLNKRVIVSLVGKREYNGTLNGYDKPYMNLVLRDVEEIVGENTKKLNVTVIRGASIAYISP
jgi:small nuclear ribonucleoprotein